MIMRQNEESEFHEAISINYEFASKKDEEAAGEKFKTLLESTDRIESLKLDYYGLNDVEKEEKVDDPEKQGDDSENTKKEDQKTENPIDIAGVKLLVAKHGAEIKKMEIKFSATEVESKAVRDLLECLENVINVEKVTVGFDWSVGDIKWKSNSATRPDVGSSKACCDSDSFGSSDEDDIKTGPAKMSNPFQHLKFLQLKKESSTVFDVFRVSKKIETLELLSFGGEDVDLMTTYLMFSNSSKTLKNLKVHFENNVDVQKIKDLVKTLQSAEIDLKTFDFYFYQRNFNSMNLLLDFIKSQKNLETLRLGCISNKNFENEFATALTELKKWKCVELIFKEKDFSSGPDKYSKVWNLKNLENLKLVCYAESGFKVVREMLESPSQKLQKIEFAGHIKFDKGSFENLTKNYRDLVDLKIHENCSNYSSNDIFLILKSLKKLQVFKFIFPKKKDFKPDLFEKSGDLKLPEINDVNLKFNDSVEILHALKFIQLMSNLSVYRFQYWKNYTTDYLDIITSQLPNLAELYVDEHPIVIKPSIAEKIEDNLKKFNKKPELFKMNGSSIDKWINADK